MILKSVGGEPINFGPILGGSSVQGFFGLGNEYWRDYLIPWPLRPNFKDMTFVAKTTTLHARDGNMPLTDKLRPRAWLPDCIKVHWRSGSVLNAVGLSGPGAEILLGMGHWQKRQEPFMLSFMSVAESSSNRLAELRLFVKLLEKYMKSYKAYENMGLQINFSCPNTGHDTSMLVNEVVEALNVAGKLGIPLMPKFAVTQITPQSALEIAQHEHCSGLCISNTIPWAQLPVGVQEDMAGSRRSPLAQYGGGGYSGPYALPLVMDWVRSARKCGLEKPINAGGGIRTPVDAVNLLQVGADSVFIASVAMTHPLMVQKIIKAVHVFV